MVVLRIFSAGDAIGLEGGVIDELRRSSVVSMAVKDLSENTTSGSEIMEVFGR